MIIMQPAVSICEDLLHNFIQKRRISCWCPTAVRMSCSSSQLEIESCFSHSLLSDRLARHHHHHHHHHRQESWSSFSIQAATCVRTCFSSTCLNEEKVLHRVENIHTFEIIVMMMMCLPSWVLFLILNNRVSSSLLFLAHSMIPFFHLKNVSRIHTAVYCNRSPI